MTFFYDLNKRLAAVNDKPETQQLNERDMGKHNNATTGFKALAKKTGGGEKGDKIAGAQFQKMKKAGQLEEDGLGNVVKKVGGMVKKVGGAVLNKLGHGDDADMIRDLQRKMGVPQTGKKPEQKTTEAAKWRDPKYKDKLYTQEPRDYDQYDYGDDDYYNPKPDNYPGEKNLKGGSEFDHNDPLQKGQGIGRTGIKHNINLSGKRKGLPSRDQITSLKGSIKDAHGTHAQPNLPEAGAPMSTKQKSFAALAPPTDKITFADKIAGAKKEVDEMLGDVAAEAMKSALSGGQKKLDKNHNGKLDATDFAMLRKGGKKEVADEASQDNAFTAHKRPKEEPDMRQGERRKTHTGGEIEKTSDTSIRHHAGRNYSGDEEDADTKKADKADAMARRASGEKSKLGRKEGSKKRIGAKINTGTSKLMTKEGDNEGGGDLKAAMALLKKAGYKVSKATAESEDDAPFDADPPKKNPSALAGKHGQGHSTAKHLAKQGMKNVSKDKDKEKEEVEETSDNAPSKSSGGVSYGKGIYDSMNRDVENAITESMAQLNESLSINMSSSTEGGKSLTVTATEEDAMKLAVLLKMSGLGGGQGMEQSNEACPSCGSSSCNCDQMDEAYGDTVETQNNPDYPTNTETSGNAMQYSGGLDGPKSTGQSTVPVLASQEDRQATYAEDADLRRMMEMAGIQEAKKPDFLTKDGDKKEPMKKAIDDKDDKKVKESIFDLTNQWKAYKAQ